MRFDTLMVHCCLTQLKEQLMLLSDSKMIIEEGADYEIKSFGGVTVRIQGKTDLLASEPRQSYRYHRIGMVCFLLYP